MASIYTCPLCEQHVSVPAEAGPSAHVRCPHCEADYTLGEAEEYMPPAVLVLDPSEVESTATTDDLSLSGDLPLEAAAMHGSEPTDGLAPAEFDAVTSTATLETETTPAEGDSQVLSGAEAAKILTPEPRVDAGAQIISASAGLRVQTVTPDAAEDTPGVATTEPGQEEAAPAYAETSAPALESSASTVDLSIHDSPSPTAEADAMPSSDAPTDADTWQDSAETGAHQFGFLKTASVGESAGSATAPGVTTSARPPEGAVPKVRRRAPPPTSPLEIVKVAIGGMLGLLFAYVILLWCGIDPVGFGPKFPRWLVPKSVEGPQETPVQQQGGQDADWRIPGGLGE